MCGARYHPRRPGGQEENLAYRVKGRATVPIVTAKGTIERNHMVRVMQKTAAPEIRQERRKKGGSLIRR